MTYSVFGGDIEMQKSNCIKYFKITQDSKQALELQNHQPAKTGFPGYNLCSQSTSTDFKYLTCIGSSVDAEALENICL